jgi:hypothetical protein
MSASSPADPNNCALDAQGSLKYASEIQFYDSKGHTPISILSTKGKVAAHPSSKSTLLCCNELFSSVDPVFWPASKAFHLL